MVIVAEAGEEVQGRVHYRCVLQVTYSLTYLLLNSYAII